MGKPRQNRPFLYRENIADLALIGHNETAHDGSRVEFGATYVIASQATTILFSTEQALALKPALRRYADYVEFHPPFAYTLFQFDTPIPESRLLETTEREEEEDKILALLVSQSAMTDPDKTVNNAILWFSSTRVNRCVWSGEKFLFKSEYLSERDVRTKEAIKALAIGCCTYLNCINLTLEKQEVPEKLRKSREKRGKSALEDYYVCRVKGSLYADTEHVGTGVKHSIRYDVRGHFRKIQDNKVSWVRPHQRGISNERYVPKAYDAKE